jgi:hypothetical protein
VGFDRWLLAIWDSRQSRFVILWSRGLGRGEERLASRATTVEGICSSQRWIDMGHALVRLAKEIDWSFLDQRFSVVLLGRAGSAAAFDRRALEKLVDLAKRSGVPLRQSYVRVVKRAAIMVGRYSHAHQFKRARRALKFLRIRLGRIVRDITRKIENDADLAARFTPLLDRARRVRLQDQRQRGHKIYPCMRRRPSASARKRPAPYEFGCKVSVATPVTQSRGGQFVLHAKALHGNPFDGHTLGPTIAEMTQLLGVEPRRIHVDKGYRGHNEAHKFRVWISGQARRVTVAIRREMERRAADHRRTE